MGSFLQSRYFDTLRISFEPDFTEPLKKGTIWTTSITSALNFVSTAGQCVRTLRIDLDDIIEPVIDWDTPEWAAAFSASCPNVRFLEIGEGSSEWIRGRLEDLRLCFPPHIDFVEHSCPRLRHIKLTLWESHETTMEDSNVWEKIGGTLQSMRIAFGWACADEIRKMRKHCRALKSVDIRSFPNHSMITTELSELLSSYGLQLEFATLYDLSEVQLKTVAEACPNARFELEVKRTRLMPALDVLGLQLEKAVIHNSAYGCEQEELGRAWRSCSNLKEIWFFPGCELADYRAFFLHPKPLVRKAIIMPGDDHRADVLDLVAHGTGSLEESEMECHGLPGVKFDAFARSNQQLRSVNIEFPVESKSCPLVRRKTVEITQSFLQAPMLNCLYIGDQLSNSAIPERLWKTLARRGIDFCIQK